MNGSLSVFRFERLAMSTPWGVEFNHPDILGLHDLFIEVSSGQNNAFVSCFSLLLNLFLLFLNFLFLLLLISLLFAISHLRFHRFVEGVHGVLDETGSISGTVVFPGVFLVSESWSKVV